MNHNKNNKNNLNNYHKNHKILNSNHNNKYKMIIFIIISLTLEKQFMLVHGILVKVKNLRFKLIVG